MTEPRTQAGRSLVDEIGTELVAGGTVREYILAIEREAADTLDSLTAERRELRAAAKALIEYIGIDERYESVVWPVDRDGDGSSGADAAAKALAAALSKAEKP